MSSNEIKMVPAFGYDLIRDYLLPSILGKHQNDVLYWAGKDLARKFPCSDLHLIITFFQDAGWGTLVLEKELKDGYILHLIPDIESLNVATRSFRLEAGFIAEQLQSFNGYLTECYEEKKEKQNIIEFHVKWDTKEKLI